MIGYCIVSSGNGMVSTFYHQEFLHFLTKRSIFKFSLCFLFFLFPVFPDPGARKSPTGSDDKLLTNIYWPWNSF